ncbi:eppin-like [Dromiciops gliroides]|uniref:eppin-like n=1 Tax=Dromiciops gliroides TaxID=33562 RepID=UPI001CC79050|nr:eppin-like [Dromiciops gliroides]
MSWSGRRCPRIKVICIYREKNECIKDKDCKEEKKCCYFSCGLKCIDPKEDPCAEPKLIRPCAYSMTRWYYNIKENACYPYRYNTCSDILNRFQSHHVCKRTCLAFGHGAPVKLFELDGEAFTVLF